MSKEIIWVMGSSAAGKETFIRRAVQDDALADKLGMHSGAREACQASLEYIAQSPEDPIVAKREQILQQVPQLLEKAGVVLVKWQFVDSTAKRPDRLQRLLPDVIHRAIVLHPPEEELLGRLEQKKWWGTYGQLNWTEQELPFVTQAVEALPDTIAVQHLKSGRAENYDAADASWNLTNTAAANPGAWRDW